MGKSQILTEDGKNVKILLNVQIDKSLPKYKKWEEMRSKHAEVNMSLSDGSNPYLTKQMRETMTYANLKRIVEERNPNIEDFNVTVTGNVNEIIKETYMDSFLIDPESPFIEVRSGSKEPSGKRNLFSVVKGYFVEKLRSKKEPKVEQNAEEKVFDIIGFFSDIHNLLDSDQTGVYINRVSDIIECIGLAEVSGQIAYKEKLMRMLVINKLESILYAKGMYKALDEEAIVQLCQNSPKDLRLDYIANFTRAIPIDVIKKKVEVDKMQIFDNYAILHFDPEGTGSDKTDKERKREIEAKKDPILFGLISGSKKLYFISDWIDDKCDLTLDKVIELTSKEVVESGFLKEHVDIE